MCSVDCTIENESVSSSVYRVMSSKTERNGKMKNENDSSKEKV